MLLAGTEIKTCTKHTEPTRITVPDLVGMSKEEALALLSKLKLKSAVDEKSVKGVTAGEVTQQTPKAGSKATTQTVVTITVSSGDRLGQGP